MSEFKDDIKDNEIRIIRSTRDFHVKPDALENDSIPPDKGYESKKKASKKTIKWIVSLLIFIGALVAYFVWEVSYDSSEPASMPITKIEESSNDLSENTAKIEAVPVKKYVEIQDTVINDQPLTILTPRNATPHLHLGISALTDTTATLVVQAADVRGDNGEIVGAYVLKGNLLSKGHSKAGYCAIIDGKVTIGVADTTPYLEQAIESNGDFFRQYPLVVGGQSVNNILPNSSLRKALADLNGRTVVILSHKKMTLNEFSKTLVDLGVSNAIYLVGSTAYGFATEESGSRLEFGERVSSPCPKTNYIIWD